MNKYHLAALLASLALASPARAADCSPPAWVNTVDVKQSAQDVVGIGKGATLDLARREARRSIGAKIAKARFAEIFALQIVKSEVNRTVYSKEDLLKATALAVGLNVRKPKNLQSEVVCQVHYAALSANLKVVLARVKGSKTLGDEINAALTGKIDKLEEAVVASDQGQAEKALGMPEETHKRLLLSVDSIGADDLLTSAMQRMLQKKAGKLRDGIEQIKLGKLGDQRQKAVLKLEDEARDGEKLIVAARELKNQSFVALFEMLNGLSLGGDEDAQFMLGYMYSEALGVKKDDKEALVWLKRAASKNHGPAKALIGVMIYSGRGTKANAQEAMQWLESAQGDGWKCQVELTQCIR